MTKYKVTREFMNALEAWRDNNELDAKTGSTYAFVDGYNINRLPVVVDIWRTTPDSPSEVNDRLITIVQWLNGEEVFEVEQSHKFIVRSERADENSNYHYVKVSDNVALSVYFHYATKFDTREKAQEWANSHQVIVEIDAEGNEV